MERVMEEELFGLITRISAIAHLDLNISRDILALEPRQRHTFASVARAGRWPYRCVSGAAREKLTLSSW